MTILPYERYKSGLINIPAVEESVSSLSIAHCSRLSFYICPVFKHKRVYSYHEHEREQAGLEKMCTTYILSRVRRRVEWPLPRWCKLGRQLDGDIGRLWGIANDGYFSIHRSCRHGDSTPIRPVYYPPSFLEIRMVDACAPRVLGRPHSLPWQLLGCQPAILFIDKGDGLSVKSKK